MGETQWRIRFEAADVLNSFMQKYHSELSVYDKMSEREWMHFDIIFKSLMDDLRLIVDYNFQLIQIRDSASLEQLDAAMMGEHA